MKNDPYQVDVLLRAANPVPSATSSPTTLDQRARDDLTKILATAPTPPRPETANRPNSSSPVRLWSRRLLLTGVTGVVAAGVVVATSSQPGGDGGGPERRHHTAYAATPAMLSYEPVATELDGPATLRRIANHVQRLPDDIGSGPYAHVERQSWDLYTRVDGERASSHVLPRRTETWRAADCSGLVVTTAVRPGPDREVSQRYGPGGLPSPWAPGSLSADPDTLADQLAIGHPTENGPAERLQAVEHAYDDMPLSPEVRAAVLRYIADTPGIRLTGRVTDRAGRPGLAFSLDSDYSGLPTRYTVIIASESGRLLGSEEMLTSTPGKLNVPVPSVIAYTAYLGGSYTSRLP